MKLSLTILFLASLSALAEDISVVIEPRWQGKAICLGGCVLTNDVGQSLSVTRLDFLVSDIELCGGDGAWVSAGKQFAFISFGEKRTRFTISGVPAERYDRLRFHVGLSKDLNHSDPAQHPAGHPLNPSVNGLHWGWQGGYVFFALEGHWLNSDGVGGYSYHVGTDQQLMTVTLPIEIEFNTELRVGLNVDRILSERLTEATATTHSRAGDPLVTQLRKKVEHAFTVLGQQTQVAVAFRQPQQVLIASNATPFRFTMSTAFPRPALPSDNPLTEEGVDLGNRLFNETLLSINGKQSCASCHQAVAAFADGGKPVSRGAEGNAGKRNAMPLFNLAWKSSFFWDGRADSLREQVLMPIQDKTEMHETLTNVVRKLTKTAAYPELFAGAFGSRRITADAIARALEQFLLAQTSYASKFDRVLTGVASFTDEEQRGFELFHTEYDPRREQFGADCFHCHGGPLFQNVAFANNGLDLHAGDAGRFDVTKSEADRGKFAVPSLRNVALTGPYMHDGRFQTLKEVLDHYAGGVKRSATLDPNLAKHPSGGVPLSTSDKQALIAFLKTLTDERLGNHPAIHEQAAR
ncbi:MAG TPA: MbnP family protein [Verrucomicrobiae bacterium]|nr:MbnP family protein [Verrucomicrobiae bacterium]